MLHVLSLHLDFHRLDILPLMGLIVNVFERCTLMWADLF